MTFALLVLSGCSRSGFADASQDGARTGTAPTDTATDTGSPVIASCPFEGDYVEISRDGSAVFSSDGVGCVLDLVLPDVEGCDMFETNIFEPGLIDGTWTGGSNGITSCYGEELWAPYLFNETSIAWSDDETVLTVFRDRSYMSGVHLFLQ